MGAHAQSVDRIAIPAWPPPPSPEVEKRVLAVLASGSWGSTQGDVVNGVTARLARLHQVRHATCCANGTIAIVLALKAAGVRPGDEVIVPAYTFFATASAPLLIGAIPVFAEIDPATLLLDAGAVRERVGPRTKAIVPVHIAGAVADAAAMRAEFGPAGIVVIEDAAQAIGARHRKGGVGQLGDMACLSFQTSKNVAAGEGGAVLADADRFGDLLWSLHNAGRVPGGAWYHHEYVGWNLRLTEMQGVLVDAMLDELDTFHARRDAGWRNLADLARVEGLPMRPVEPEDTTQHARHLMPWLLDTARNPASLRDRVVAAIEAAGVPVSKGYPCLNRNPAIAAEIAAFGGRPPDPLPVTERAADRTFWLPQTVLIAGEDAHRAAIAAIARALG